MAPPTTKNGGAHPAFNSIGNITFPLMIPHLAIAIINDTAKALKKIIKLLN